MIKCFFDKIITSTSEHRNLLPMLETLYPMEDFYSKNGEPSEQFSYCRYQVNIGILPFSYRYMEKHNLSEEQYVKENGYDWETLALITNTPTPYIRCTYETKGYAYPCGRMEYVSPENSYALLSPEERNQKYPIIAYGIGAIFIWNLDVNTEVRDFVLSCPDEILMEKYYKNEFEKYLSSHSSRKYAHLSYQEKEQSFLQKHIAREKALWLKSSKLEDYELLHKYTKDFVLSYLDFLKKKSLPKIQEKQAENKNATVYVSYPWADSQLMDDICSALDKHNIQYKRDVNDCGYRQNITKFEEEIADAKIIVAIINETSLHSIDCMYEMCRMVENGHIEKRLFPIISLPKSLKRNAECGEQMTKYWKKEFQKRKRRLLPDTSNSLLLEELQFCSTIITEFPKFWKYVSRHNSLTKETLVNGECKLLIEEILKADTHHD